MMKGLAGANAKWMMKGLAGARVLLWFEILISLAYSRYIRKAERPWAKGAKAFFYWI